MSLLPIAGRVISIASPLAGPAAPAVAAGGNTVTAIGEARQANRDEARTKARNRELIQKKAEKLARKQTLKTDPRNTGNIGNPETFGFNSSMIIPLGLAILIVVLAARKR